MRVLLVEDDGMIAQGLQTALRQANYAVDWRDLRLDPVSHTVELALQAFLGLEGSAAVYR
jgi:hypothetical protein